jgi:Cu-Zn family superoxide dismutase
MQRAILTISMMFIAVLGACGGDTEEQDGMDENPDMEETPNEEETNGQAGGNGVEEGSDNAASEEEVLVSMEDAEGNVVATALLTEGEEGVNIELEAENLPPGTKGFHIHENPECGAPDFESAGGHFNPTNANHGFNDPEGPHAGDLPNIEVTEDGTAYEEVTADMVTLEQEGENSLYADGGTSLMIHAEADDYESQPAGDAGDRIACGVISE